MSLFLFFSALTLAGIGKNICGPWWTGKRHMWLDQKRAEEYIPYMTEIEKEVIGYLLHHNQRRFRRTLLEAPLRH